MNEKELAGILIDRQIIAEFKRSEAEAVLKRMIEAKGEQAVTDKVLLRRKSMTLVSTILTKFLEDLPDKPPEETKPVKTIEEELAEERRDMTEAVELLKAFNRPFSEPNDQRFEMHPSIFDGTYHGHEEYKTNTYISVYREAKEKRTSMHEICRQKNLEYDLLIQ